MMYSKKLFETFIYSSGGNIEFIYDDEEMMKLLNSKVEMLRSSEPYGLHPTLVIPQESQTHCYPLTPEWHHMICNLENNLGDVLAMGHIYVCLSYEIFAMKKIGPNHVILIVINIIMAGQGDWIMSMRMWPLTRNRFANDL